MSPPWIVSSLRGYPTRTLENGFRVPDPGSQAPLMFLFFSNNLGCLGSILVSVIATLFLLLLLGVLN